ncbi:MAG: cytochrome P450 [Candidatus Eremiobacteraeota bacterium]|nr:cytochrome P450 [Candidatus Eremiobacteraeota bacterium]
MSTAARHPVSDLDPFSELFMSDPFHYHAELRAAGPVVWLERYGIWGISHYAEVFAAVTDAKTFISSAGVGITDFRREAPPRPPSIVLEADPPLHTRTHKILARVLSPAALRSMREACEREAEALVDKLVEARNIAAVNDAARAYATKVFADALGLPETNRDALLPYGTMVFNFFGPHNALYTDAMLRAPKITEHIMHLCERNSLKEDGLAAAIYAAHDAGECTYAEAGMLVRSLLSAGLDTTINGLACAFVCFAKNPEEWDRLRSDGSLARNAFDEAIRLESPVQTFFRTVSRQVELGGVVLEDGAKVLLFYASANRDPRKWQEPDRFDVTRKTAPHLGFGAGIHRCVGEMLSKVEGEILIREFARRVRRFTLTAEPTLRFNNTLRAYERIPLQLEC